ncbi:hypothetical protein bAD24_p01090 (plasmid) [Burkholderia sp. AD24]|nr:hypothetical protein bAD24_p01090 [Burkholderia sp. AD24]
MLTALLRFVPSVGMWIGAVLALLPAGRHLLELGVGAGRDVFFDPAYAMAVRKRCIGAVYS